MTFDEFVEHMRAEIRENGFMNAVQLASVIAVRMKERSILGKFKLQSVLSQIECSNIHRVEYTNLIASNRVKDLYYYNPNQDCCKQCINCSCTKEHQ